MFASMAASGLMSLVSSWCSILDFLGLTGSISSASPMFSSNSSNQSSSIKLVLFHFIIFIVQINKTL